MKTVIMAVIMAAVSGMAQETNYIADCSAGDVICVTSTSMWNFIVEAKNLTDEEQIAYNDITTYRNASSIREIVLSIDARRELEKTIAIVNSKTNLTTRWVGSVVIQHYRKTGPHAWVMDGYSRRLGMMADPEKEIGFRSDGVVVWRVKECEE